MKCWNASRCKELLDQGTVLALDIREPYEYQHVNCGFNNVPMATLIEFLQEKDRTTPLVLYVNQEEELKPQGI
jgi:rhodanese-related sulfurtransferase